MHFNIPLKQMSVEDKLQATKEIWADLAGTKNGVKERGHFISRYNFL